MVHPYIFTFKIMVSIICKECLKSITEDKLSKDKYCKYGYRNICKDCRNVKSRKRNKTPTAKAYSSSYKKKNATKLKAYDKEYQLTKKRKAYIKVYQNSDVYKAYQREYKRKTKQQWHNSSKVIRQNRTKTE